MMRDRLIELIQKIQDNGTKTEYGDWTIMCSSPKNEELADHLLANGVIVPPCKVGDTVYVVGLHTGQIITLAVDAITYCSDDVMLLLNCAACVSVKQQLGKTVFLTREQAELKLKEASYYDCGK